MKRIYFSILAAFFSVLAIAQESGGSSSGGSSVSVTKTESSNTTNIPWLWIVIGVVFLIILIALLSGRRGGSDTVVERKTIIKE